MQLTKFTTLSIFLLLISSVSQAQTEGASLDERGYGVYVPSTYDANGEDELPLLIALHGFGDTWQNFSLAHGFNLAAEQANFIVATPQGYLNQWNAGDRGDHYEDDIQLLRELIERIDRDFRIDHERIYLAGFSNGSTMTYYVACNAPDLVDGIAAVGGTMWRGIFDTCDEDTTLPVFMMHGTGDTVVSFYGGGGRVAVSEATVLWAERNGCNTEDVPEFDEAFFRNGYAVYLYEECPDGNIVMMEALEDVGHVWVGFDYYVRGTFPPAIQIDTARLIWGFFDYSYQLKTEADAPEVTPEATEATDE